VPVLQPHRHQPSASRDRQGWGRWRSCFLQGPLGADTAAWACLAFPRLIVQSQLCCAQSTVFQGLIHDSSGSATQTYTWGDVCLSFSILSAHLHPHPDTNVQKLTWKDISGMLLQVSRPKKKISIEEKRRNS